MSNSLSSVNKPRRPLPLVEAVWFSRTTLSFDLSDGRSISVPLSFYPPLLAASEDLRRGYEIHASTVYWDGLKLKLTASDLLSGRRKG